MKPEKINSKYYKPIPGSCCLKCDLFKLEQSVCVQANCTKYGREDKIDVYFVEVDDED